MYIAEIIYPGPTPNQFQENDYDNEHVEKSRNINSELHNILYDLGGEDNGFDSDSNGIIFYHYKFKENKEDIIREKITEMFKKYNVPVNPVGKSDQYSVTISVYEEE